jgi:cytochrome P450
MYFKHIHQGTKMSIKSLVGKKMSKEVTFMGEKVKISKLSVSQVEAIQEAAKEIEKNPEKGFDVLKVVVRAGAEGGGDLTDEEFADFSMDELSKLSAEIMKFSGIAGDSTGK